VAQDNTVVITFQIKNLGPARNIKNNSSPMICYSLWSEKLCEIAPKLLIRWPACFIFLFQSSHYFLLPFFGHLGYINGEMGRNHSNYLEKEVEEIQITLC
jgi:hypothetical protein